MPRMISTPLLSRASLKRRARSFADTATTAMTATVIAVPSPITRVAAMPAQNKPCASANTSTRIAPEQGRMPTVKIAARPRRLQGAHEAAALGPDQADAKGRNQGITADLDRLLGATHGLRGGIEQPGADGDDRDRDQRLHQRGCERQRDAAKRGLLVGDQIG